MVSFFSIKKKEWLFFIAVLIIYSVCSGLPKLFAYAGIFFKLVLLKFFYNILKKLLSVLVSGSFFYLIFETWNEKSKIKNELIYTNCKYKQMKRDILLILMSAEQDRLKQVKDEETKEIYLDPKEAQEYFNQEKFEKIFFNLDDRSLRSILRSMQSFLESFSNIKDHFVQSGDFSYAAIFDDIKEYSYHIEEWLADPARGMDWCESAELKSWNRLYLLFCREQEGKDPILEKLSAALKKYG